MAIGAEGGWREAGGAARVRIGSMRFVALLLALGASVVVASQSSNPLEVDKTADKWVQSTLKKMSLEDKVGQMLVSSFQSNSLTSTS